MGVGTPTWVGCGVAEGTGGEVGDSIGEGVIGTRVAVGGSVGEGMMGAATGLGGSVGEGKGV